jgi:hypothetical protein
MSRQYKIATAAVGLMALPLVALAQPAASPLDAPTGDVWITPGGPSPSPTGAGRAGSVNAQLPTGDVWPAEGGMTRTAQPAPPQAQAAAREDIAAGSVK